MEKTYLDGDQLNQLTNAPSTESDTSSVSSNHQEASSKKSKPLSYGELFAVLQAAIETGLMIVGLLYIALLLPRQISGDGRHRYQDLLGVLSTHSLFQPHSWFSLIGPFFSLPLLLIGETLGHPEEWTSFYNLILFSLCLLLSYFMLRNHVDRALLRKFFLVLIYGSMFVTHLSFYYGEVFTTLCVGFGVLIAFRRFTSIGGWIAVILGVANSPATLIGLGLLVLKRMLDSKRLQYILVFAAAALCMAIESWLRRGNLVNPEYVNNYGGKNIMPYSGRPGFSYPFLFGLLSILLSFNRGLIFFAPGWLLPIRKTLFKWQQDQQINLYQVYTLWMCFLVGLVLIYSPWWSWGGGLFWGPRYFLFASIPASFALAVRLIRYKDASLGVNLLTLVVFCLSAWVSVNGAVFQQYVVYPRVCKIDNGTWFILCRYTLEYSNLWMPFIFHIRINQAQKMFLLFSLLVAIYLVVPLFIHLLKQIGDAIKQYSREYVNVKQWHI